MLKIPSQLPVLFIPGGIVLPGVSVRFKINSSRGIALIKSRLLKRSTLASTLVGIVPTDPAENREFDNAENSIGTAAVVVQVAGTTWPRHEYTILVSGVERFRILHLKQTDPYALAQVEALGRINNDGVVSNDKDEAIEELIETFRKKAINLLEMLDLSQPSVGKLRKMLETVPSHQMADIISAIVQASFKEKMEILSAVDLRERFEKALPLLQRQIEGLKLLQEKQEKKMRDGETIGKNRQLISKNSKGDHLDDVDEADEIADLEVKLSQAKLPENVQKVAMKELKRIKKMSPQMPEYPMLRHYLELVSELPWNKASTDQIDIRKAREDLDSDHYAMEEVKKRVLEYLAVRQLKNSLRGPILCFVGPPGVGKTSIGKSIASTLGRQFHRISLGGVSDQSDIRGHRRTYIGSMPGRFIQGLKFAGTNNPVFLLDEIDKLSAGIHGDPAAALLEVLDPEQNANFVDHYLNVPFDLSQVIFIATANSTRTIPRPLMDRMEVIKIPGYTIEDKLPIGKIHLLPKQLKMHGLNDETMQITDDALKFLVSRYTLEAGVRGLERKLGALCRAVAVRVAELEKSGAKEKDLNSAVTNMKIKNEEREKAIATSQPPNMPIVLDETAIEDILGPPLYENSINARLGQIGVAVGLAWTSVGGEVMIVEALRMPGDSSLVLTGQLGEVMKESATLALSWIRAHAKQLEIASFDEKESLMKSTDVHIHFPEGAIGKDGPSAGVTITTALVSLFTEKPTIPDLAMTGEITLRGVVLPVGGIKEKVIAAYRSGFTKVVLPKLNKKDLKDIPNHIKEAVNFIYVNNIEEVLEHAFDSRFNGLILDEDHHELSKL